MFVWLCSFAILAWNGDLVFFFPPYKVRIFSIDFDRSKEFDYMGNVMNWLIFFCLLDTAEGHLGRENPSWKNVSIRLACRQVCGDIFLISN